MENPPFKFTWRDNWALIPDSASGRANGRTHGICITRQNRVMVFHQAENAILTYDVDGRLLSAVGGKRWTGAHGMTLVEENGTEYLWLTDQDSKEVAKVTLRGDTVMTLNKPQHLLYEQGGTYTPTWVAQNPDNGDIWLADGYGSSLVHRHDRNGRQLGTLDGTEGAGRFNTPHGIAMRRGNDGVELWIADRTHCRIVIYDGEGIFRRRLDYVHSPCGFDFKGDYVVVPELLTGVKIIHTESLKLVTEIGANPRVTTTSRPSGWPDLLGTGLVAPGYFNSPHAAAFGQNGDIFCVEWIKGGRITRLIPV